MAYSSKAFQWVLLMGILIQGKGAYAFPSCVEDYVKADQTIEAKTWEAESHALHTLYLTFRLDGVRVTHDLNEGSVFSDVYLTGKTPASENSETKKTLSAFKAGFEFELQRAKEHFSMAMKIPFIEADLAAVQCALYLLK